MGCWKVLIKCAGSDAKESGQLWFCLWVHALWMVSCLLIFEVFFCWLLPNLGMEDMTKSERRWWMHLSGTTYSFAIKRQYRTHGFSSFMAFAYINDTKRCTFTPIRSWNRSQNSHLLLLLILKVNGSHLRPFAQPYGPMRYALSINLTQISRSNIDMAWLTHFCLDFPNGSRSPMTLRN